jgi:hypothetical protein
MKYSLRSLMILVTLVCVLLGGRIEYLRRWAVFHERQLEADKSWNSAKIDGTDWLFYSEVQAKKYRAAMWRPWTFVDETPAP